MDYPTSLYHAKYPGPPSMYYIPQRINQLQQGYSLRPITVCIRNTWKIQNHKFEEYQDKTGFICYDHHGQLLEGQLTGGAQPGDPAYLNEGDIYEFSGFSVLHNSRKRTLTQLPYYIQIDKETVMWRLFDKDTIFPYNTFSPQNYRSLLRLATEPAYLPDVVGQILIMQRTKPFQPEQNTEFTIGLLLNRSIVVKLTLWNSLAADFSIAHSRKNRKFRIVLFTSIIPKIINGKLQLTSSPATKFYFNKSISYIKHFKGRVRHPRKS